MPRIAIAPCGKLHDYEESVRRAGGDPWVLDSVADHPDAVIGSVQGLLLAGGGDVHPDLYGAAMHPTFSPAEPGRDIYEFELIERAMAADVPLFAICRGIQVLNVARGGTLVQDIPTQVPDALDHRLAVPPHEPMTLAHEIWIEKGSLLARITREALEGHDSCQVNSRHHQAVDRLARGFVSTATAPDGLVEAIEDPSRRFCLGVQWHPENFYRTGEFRSLFEGFIAACRV